MKKQKVLIFLLLTGIAALTFILATSLNQIKLQPGQLAAIHSRAEVKEAAMALPPVSQFIMQVLLKVVAFLIILAPVFLISILVKKNRAALKEIILKIVIYSGLLYMVFLLIQYITIPEMPVSTNDSVAIIPEANPPVWITWIISMVIAVFIAVVGIFFIRLLPRRREPSLSLEQVAGKAKDALDLLEKGGNLQEIIIRCYKEMLTVVSETRGVIRSGHLTPREFEKHLETCGVPLEPLSGLTRLFEQVRYGKHIAGQQEQQLAIKYLHAIANVYQPGKKR